MANILGISCFYHDSAASLLADGKIVAAAHEERFSRRKHDPLRQWKLSEVDIQAQERWDEFTEMKYEMLRDTHTNKAPWIVIRSDDKHLARRETMKVILNRVRYRGRNRKLDFTMDPEIVIPGDRELKIMKTQRKKYGKSLV